MFYPHHLGGGDVISNMSYQVVLIVIAVLLTFLIVLAVAVILMLATRQSVRFVTRGVSSLLSNCLYNRQSISGSTCIAIKSLLDMLSLIASSTSGRFYTGWFIQPQ